MNKIKNILKKVIILQLILVISLFIYCPASKADEPVATDNVKIAEQATTPKVLSKSAILMDQETGQILYEHNSREKTYPASTTKLMTAILTMENCDLTDEVTVPKDALLGIPRSYTIADLRAGETFTVDQLMHVLLIPSANDAANVLACHISGSVADFAEKMNAKAMEIGCENTHFTNPSGIHDDNHYSTAYDMALIGKYASKYSTIREIATNTSYSLPDTPDGKTRTFKTTNTLITQKHKYYYEKATGLKTGYTDKAKSCIVATASENNTNLLCVVLGGDKTEDRQPQREIDCTTLFEYGFDQFKYENLCEKNNIVNISEVSETPSCLENANIAYDDTLKILVKNDATITSDIKLNNFEELPIQKGTVVGTITYHVDDANYTINLVASEDILPKSSKSTQNIFFILIGILAAFILLSLMKNKKKKKKKKETRYFKRSLY